MRGFTNDEEGQKMNCVTKNSQQSRHSRPRPEHGDTVATISKRVGAPHYAAVVCILALCLAIVAIGCHPSAGSISGTKWKHQTGNRSASLEFFSDNTFTIGLFGGLSGKWVVLDDGRIKFDIPSENPFFAVVKGKSLTLDLAGEQMQFTRDR